MEQLANEENLDLYVSELDITDDASLEKAVAEVIENAGRIDVLNNNAGVMNVRALGTRLAARSLLTGTIHRGFMRRTTFFLVFSLGLLSASIFFLEAAGHSPGPNKSRAPAGDDRRPALFAVMQFA